MIGEVVVFPIEIAAHLVGIGERIVYAVLSALGVYADSVGSDNRNLLFELQQIHAVPSLQAVLDIQDPVAGGTLILGVPGLFG